MRLLCRLASVSTARPATCSTSGLEAAIAKSEDKGSLLGTKEACLGQKEACWVHAVYVWEAGTPAARVRGRVLCCWPQCSVVTNGFTCSGPPTVHHAPCTHHCHHCHHTPPTIATIATTTPQPKAVRQAFLSKAGSIANGLWSNEAFGGAHRVHRSTEEGEEGCGGKGGGSSRARWVVKRVTPVFDPQCGQT